MGFVVGSVVALCAAALALSPVAAHAQPTAPAAPAGAASKKTEDRDRQAKRLFVSGNYKEAIEVLTDLYSDTGNPIYLRNIARCYQRLRDPDRAIASFEEYLLRGKDIPAHEREEVKGFIREQEELKRRSAEASAAGKPAPSPAAASPAPGPASPGPAAARPTAPAGPPPFAANTPAAPAAAPLASASPPATAFAPLPAPAAEPPLAGMVTAPGTPPPGRWKRTAGVVGMVTAGALAAGAGVVMTTSWISYNRGKDNGCGRVMTCESRAKGLETRNTITAILLGGAAVAGVTGVTLFLLGPPPAPEASARPASGLQVAVRGGF
jgi:hypothetical protein